MFAKRWTPHYRLIRDKRRAAATNSLITGAILFSDQTTKLGLTGLRSRIFGFMVLSTMPFTSKFLRPILITTILAVNIFVIGLLAFALSMAKVRKEQEIRTTVENVALLLDHNISELVDKIDLSLRETANYLEREIRSRGRLDDLAGNALLAERRAWLSELAALQVIDALARCVMGWAPNCQISPLSPTATIS